MLCNYSSRQPIHVSKELQTLPLKRLLKHRFLNCGPWLQKIVILLENCICNLGTKCAWEGRHPVYQTLQAELYKRSFYSQDDYIFEPSNGLTDNAGKLKKKETFTRGNWSKEFNEFDICLESTGSMDNYCNITMAELANVFQLGGYWWVALAKKTSQQITSSALPHNK